MSQVSRRNRGDGNLSTMMKMMVICLVMFAFVGVDGSATASGRSFFPTKQRGNYTTVKQECINEGGSIASIRSAAEDGQAAALCRQIPGNGQAGECLIGLTDLAEEGTFRWDDNSALTYTNWFSSQPNNLQNQQHCTALAWAQDKWNDVRCYRMYYGICQTSATLEEYTCPPGTYDKSAPTEPCVCEECPAGHYCEGGDAGKEECHKGYFQPLKGQSACDPSPKGHKVPNKGAEHPTACPPGEYQNLEAQDSCKACLKGNYCPGTGNENPTPCEGGEYQDERGKDSCDDCPKGNKCPGLGNKEPTKCWNGQYQNDEGKEICKDCPIGNKCAGEGNENPTACGSNTFQPCTGQETCIPCEAPAMSGAGADSCAPPPTTL